MILTVKGVWLDGCYESRLKELSQEITLILKWHKRTR